MSDDKIVADATLEVPPEVKAASDELKKVIAERDKAKAKLRERDEQDKKAAETKAIEDGNLRELLSSRDVELTALRKQVEAVEAAKAQDRQKALDEVTDPVLKPFAEKMGDGAEIREFVRVIAEKKLTTHTANDKKTAPEAPKYKSITDMQRAQGGSIIPTL